jgi:hypothetical protein
VFHRGVFEGRGRRGQGLGCVDKVCGEVSAAGAVFGGFVSLIVVRDVGCRDARIDRLHLGESLFIVVFNNSRSYHRSARRK